MQRKIWLWKGNLLRGIVNQSFLLVQLNSNQVYIVTFTNTQLTQAEMAQSLSSLQKSEFLKLIISFFHYFLCQNWDHKRVWAEKIGKKQKNFKNLKVAGNYPNI